MSDPGKEVRKANIGDLGDPQAIISDFLRNALARGVFDAVLIPMMVPAGDGFAYLLIKKPDLLEVAWPMPPVLGTPGGEAVSAMTRLGGGKLRMCAVMRPCEARAAVELAKLGQADLSNLTLLTMDCAGAFPLQEFSKDPKGEIARFKGLDGGSEEGIRPICRVCRSTGTAYGDLHVGLFSGRDRPVPLIATTKKGYAVIERLGLPPMPDTSKRDEEAERIDRARGVAREEWRRDLGERAVGAENLLKVLSACINCHNCMRVCPVCYCRQCYFDSEKVRHPADDYLDQAKRKGALRFPPDMVLFHLGRMTHMSLTCVSCGACEDACPASIPIAQLFSYVAERAQKRFDYVPGRDLKDPLPLIVYKENELEDDDG
jgi:formate dehydrogenase (coenzyme F420) beta subunit